MSPKVKAPRPHKPSRRKEQHKAALLKKPTNNHSMKRDKGFMTRAGEVGNKALSALHDGRNYLIGEGPRPLRVLCFLGGLSIVIFAMVGSVDFFTFVKHPAPFTLQGYLVVFGVASMIAETKDVLVGMEPVKQWLTKWCRFLTVPGGKGAMYMFMGVLATSLWNENKLVACAGIYMVVIGFICLLVHCGMSSQLRRAGIDVTKTYAGGGYNPMLTGDHPTNEAKLSTCSTAPRALLIEHGTAGDRQYNDHHQFTTHLSEWGPYPEKTKFYDLSYGQHKARSPDDTTKAATASRTANNARPAPTNTLYPPTTAYHQQPPRQQQQHYDYYNNNRRHHPLPDFTQQQAAHSDPFKSNYSKVELAGTFDTEESLGAYIKRKFAN